jgi:hypothetical protein
MEDLYNLIVCYSWRQWKWKWNEIL